MRVHRQGGGRRPRVGVTGCAVLVAVLAAGCGSGTEDLARQAAVDFEAAVAENSPRACELLTDRARDGADCAALGLPSGQVDDVVVRGDAARVRAGSDTLFLRELASGWRVAGAGCRPVDGRPYACDVGGP